MKFILIVAAFSLLAMSNMVFAQYCNPGFQNNFQCSGNWQQQLYINPDCSQYWSSIQYCNSGCFNGFCSGVQQTSSACSISASMTTPQSITNGDLTSTTILFTNSGGTSGTVNVNAFICRADGSNCFNIQCSSSQVFVPANSVAYDVCSSRNYNGYYPSPYGINSNNYPYYQNQNPYQGYPNYPYSYYSGAFRIRADLSGCNLGQTMYTSVFQIQPYQYCTPGTTSNYQCSGNARQVQYTNADCTTRWQTVDTCQNGCSNGVCLAGTSTSTSTVTTTVTAQPQYNFGDIWIFALILAVIVLMIIFIRLFNDGFSERKSYREGDETWRAWRENLGNIFSRATYRKTDDSKDFGKTIYRNSDAC